MTRHKSKAMLLALSISTASILTFSNSAGATAPEIYFYPAQSWTVSTGAMEVADANIQNCKISNQFNNGFIFQLDGNHKWVQSMSVDFRQKSFTAGDTYDVSFSVPGKTTQTITAMAKEDHLLVFNMQKQKMLYQAMRDSSVVDMKIDSNDFRFYMTGFSTAAGNFERCMAGAVITPATADGALHASMSEDPYANSITWNESIALEEIERAGGVDAPSESALQAPTATITKTDFTNEPLLVANDVKTEKTPLTATLASIDNVFSPPAYDDETPRKRMSERLAEEINKNPEIIAYQDDPRHGSKSTKSAVKEPEMAAIEVEEPKAIAPMDTAEMVKSPLIPERPKMKVNRTHSYIEADFSSFADVEPASSSMAFESKSDPELIKKISQLEKVVNKLQAENTALNGDIESALKDSETERMVISSENWNLERSTMRYNESERQVKRLGQQLQRERAECTLEKKDLEALLFDPQVTSQQQLARLSQLERALEKAQSKLRVSGIAQ